jgi:hypothetical protein
LLDEGGSRRGHAQHLRRTDRSLRDENPLLGLVDQFPHHRGGLLGFARQLSFFDLLDQGASLFPPERAAAIRTALAIKCDR